MMSERIVFEVSPQNSFSGVSIDHVTVMGFPNLFMRERDIKVKYPTAAISQILQLVQCNKDYSCGLG